MTVKADSEIVDITDFLPTHSFRLEIIGVHGKPLGWWWTLAASSHEKHVAFTESRAAKNLERAKVIREAQFNGQRYEAEATTPQQDRREDVQWIVARTLDFTPIKIGEEVFNYSDKAVEDLLIRPELNFAAMQIIKALNDDVRFIKRAAAP